MNIPIVIDDSVPRGIIQFRNSKGEIVGLIYNIGEAMVYKTEEYPDGKGRERNGSPYFYDLLSKAAEIHDKKSHDYANNDNPFGNYQFAGLISKLFDNPDDAGFAGRIAEKLYRLANLENSGKTALNETVEDTEIDVFTIMGLWMASRKKRRETLSAAATIRITDNVTDSGMGNQKINPPRDIQNQRSKAIKDLDVAMEKGSPSNLRPDRLNDGRFHRELRAVFNKYGIDTELNVSDDTIVMKVLSDLINWRAQIG